MEFNLSTIYRATSRALALILFFSFSQQINAQVKLDFSHERGFSDAPFDLTITATDPTATIRYTLNGEEPSPTSGTVYSGSIPVQTTTVLRAIGFRVGIDTSKIYTHSYLFLDDVIQQPKNIEGWPNNSYDLGGSGSAIHDYEMDPAIVNSSQYRDDLIKGLKDIPSMSIVMPRADFWEIYDGEAERKTSVELLYADDATKNEQEDGGIEPHSHNRLKRSMRLSFKSRYGAKDWDSKIFRNAAVGSETAVDEFDRIVLRGGNNRAWSRNWNEDRTAFTRDEWFRQSQIASSGIGSHGTFVHLYVNGLYWGLYNPVERPDEDFTSSYLGGVDDNWFAISHGGVRSGDRTRFDYMNNVILNRNLTQSSNYEELKAYLDVEQFSDYILLSWMTGVQDWPGNNWWAGNNNNPAGPIMYFGWDNEWSWDVTRNANNGAWVHPDFRSNDTGGRNSAFVFNKAKVNDDFMMTFADRVYKLCFNNGAMTDDNSRLRWSTLNNQIENAVVAESARWGDGLEDGVTRTRDIHWRSEVDRLDGLMDGNVDRLIDALLNEGYYPTIDPPLFVNNNTAIEVQELAVSSNYSIDLVNPNSVGQIYYTTNGVDPRLSGGELASDALLFSGQNVFINSSTNLLARVKRGDEWSALHCLNLIVDQDLSWIKLTEIMYHPADFPVGADTIGGSELEYLEIKNTSTNLTLDVSGLQISDGVEFTFPTGTLMEPQSFLVVASNAAALAQKCSGIDIFGEYSGQLSNGGETIDFATFQGDTIIRVSYDDADPWPIDADGAGYSLVPTEFNPVGGQDDYSFWKLSTDNNCGSPGADDGTVCIDSDNDGICDPQDDCDTFSFDAISDFEDISVTGFSPAYVDNTRGALAINAAIYKDQYAAATITFTGRAGTYDLELSTMAESDGESTYRIAINGVRLTETFTNPVIFGTNIPEYAAYSNVWDEVNLSPGDEIRVEFNSASNERIPEGSGFAFSRGRWTALEITCPSDDNCSLVGQLCNDGDVCTTNDRYDADCNCAGVFQDSDNDGICDAEDDCSANLVGQVCNDGDACTVNDRYDANCNCVGVFQDTDSDGVCNAEDQCPAFDDNLIGRACNDGNPCTDNDVYTSNCECAGTVSGDDAVVMLSAIDDAYLQGTSRVNTGVLRVEAGNRITYLKFDIPNNSGTLISAHLDLQVFNDAGNGQILAWSGSSNNWTEDNLSTSNRPNEVLLLASRNNAYSVGQPYTWELNPAQISAGVVSIIMRQSSGNDVSFHSSESTTTSARPQLVLTYENTSSTTGNAGAACDDGDPCTVNDVIDSNCNCTGVFADSDNDGVCNAEDACPGFNDNLIGASCNDGDVCTVDDVYTTDCECAGTFVDSDNDGICDAEDNCSGGQVGQTCNDGDVCTVNDRYDANCDCVGVFADSDNDGVCNAEDACPGFNDNLIGTACNDGDACTTGETWTSNCACAGGQMVDADNDGYCAAEDSDDNDPCVPDASDSQCNTNSDVECAELARTGFENGNMGIWIDGGSSARLLNSSGFANSGSSSFYIQGNTGVGSSLFTGDLDLQDAVSAVIEFSLLPYALESGDSFVLEVSTGGSYVQYRTYSEGSDFDNQVRKAFTVNVSGIDFSSATSFRLRSVANDVADYFIFDDLVIETCTETTDTSGQGGGGSGGTTGGGGSTTECQTLSSDGFEGSNMGIWIDGGTSARILSSASFASTGSYSFYIQGDNGIASSLYSTAQDYSNYDNLRISFNYYAYAVEAGDSFVVELDNGNGNYVQVQSLAFGQAFQNLDRNSASFIVNNINLSNAVSIRFRAVTTETADYFILDDIRIEGCGETEINCTPGSTCQPSEACFATGQYDASCNCIGSGVVDVDGDGYCAAEDSDDNNPCVPDNSGCGGGGSTDCQEISTVGFEGGQLGIWNDGGGSARLLNSATFSPTGQYCFYIQGDSGSGSSLYSNNLDFSGSTSVDMTFTFYPYNMEQGDRFHLEVNSGAGYQTVQTFVAGSDFTNENVTTESVSIPGSMLSGSTSLRFRAEGDQVTDYVMLDDISVEDCSNSGVQSGTEINNRSRETAVTDSALVIDEQKELDIINVYPNPSSSETVTVDYVSTREYKSAALYVVDAWGKAVVEVPLTIEVGQNYIAFDPSGLAASTYFIYIQTEEDRSTVTKFVKFK